MKQTVRTLAMLMMVVACSMMMSCSSDDDDNNVNGERMVVINGTHYPLYFGFYDTEGGELHMEFINFDPFNPTNLPQSANALTINIDELSDLEQGTYKGDLEFWSTAIYTDDFYGSANGTVDVTIEKKGAYYVITIPESTVNFYYDENFDESERVSLSFNFTGPMEYSEFE